MAVFLRPALLQAKLPPLRTLLCCSLGPRVGYAVSDGYLSQATPGGHAADDVGAWAAGGVGGVVVHGGTAADRAHFAATLSAAPSADMLWCEDAAPALSAEAARTRAAAEMSFEHLAEAVAAGGPLWSADLRAAVALQCFIDDELGGWANTFG